MSDLTIDFRKVTRVEGHGNIGVRIRDGRITHLELAIVESPRFFEAFLRGASRTRPRSGPGASTHEIGVSWGLDMMAALGWAADVRLYAVFGQNFERGLEMSPAVAACVEVVAEHILRELESRGCGR